MSPIGNLLLLCLNIYMYIIIGSVIISWLIAFDVINARNPRAANLLRLIAKVTDPVYKPIRKYVPPIAGMDLSPIIIIFGIFILQNIVYKLFF